MVSRPHADDVDGDSDTANMTAAVAGVSSVDGPSSACDVTAPAVALAAELEGQDAEADRSEDEDHSNVSK